MKEIICPKCAGNGTIASFKHVEGGRCFQCEGIGKIIVDDNTIDIIEQIREEKKIIKGIEEEFNKLYTELKNDITESRTWNIILSNAQGTENLTKYEHKLKVLETYVVFKEQWRKYINEHMELMNDIDKYIEIKNDFENKYINSLEAE